MSQGYVLKLGGWAAVVGGILVVLGNLFHPREPGQLDDAESLLRVCPTRVPGSASMW